MNCVILSQRAGESSHVSDTVLGWLSAITGSSEQRFMLQQHPHVAQKRSAARDSLLSLDWIIHPRQGPHHKNSHTCILRPKYKMSTQSLPHNIFMAPLFTEKHLPSNAANANTCKHTYGIYMKGICRDMQNVLV